MTVQELIDILNEVEDKGRTVVLSDDNTVPGFANIVSVDTSDCFLSTVYIDYDTSIPYKAERSS
jgi:hypothetical protein